MFFLKLAWRNIFRNKRRTVIAAVAIGIGLASMIFTDAMMLGMEENLVKTVTSTILGDAQIHHKDYRELQKPELLINQPNKILSKLEKDDRIKNFSPRTVSFAMLNSAVNNKPVFMYGVRPNTEKKISKIDDYITEGSYVNSKKSLVLGKELAKNMEVDLNDRIILTVTSVEKNELIQEMFKITGLFEMPDKEIEKGMIFLHIDKAQNMLNINDNFQEIAVTFKNSELSRSEENFFTKQYSSSENEAVTWPTILPQMKMVFEMKTLSTSMTAIIIFGVVIFGIINTLFMSIYERMFEFSVIRAIGTRKSGLKKLITLEALSLGIFSCILGSFLGFVFTGWFSIQGIDYTGIEFNGTTFDQLLYPILTLKQFIIYPALIITFVLIVSIYPALYASKINIAKAIRKSL